MKKKLLPVKALVLLPSLTVVGAVHAMTATSTLDVTAVVGQVCTVSTSPVVFNVVNPFSDNFATGGITVTCNPGMPFDIALDAGMHFNGVRGVTNGMYRLDYLLGSNKYSQSWGDNNLTYPAPTIFSIATGGADLFAVDGVLLGNQPPVPFGIYTDIVGVTVSY